MMAAPIFADVNDEYLVLHDFDYTSCLQRPRWDFKDAMRDIGVDLCREPGCLEEAQWDDGGCDEHHDPNPEPDWDLAYKARLEDALLSG